MQITYEERADLIRVYLNNLHHMDTPLGLGRDHVVPPLVACHHNKKLLVVSKDIAPAQEDREHATALLSSLLNCFSFKTRKWMDVHTLTKQKVGLRITDWSFSFFRSDIFSNTRLIF